MMIRGAPGAPMRYGFREAKAQVVPMVQGRPGPPQAVAAVLAAPTPNKIQPQLQNLPGAYTAR
ncbi:unnamed protein product [Effrenium voratum]|nr:unnamed protein product [Effrenium voratum]